MSAPSTDPVWRQCLMTPAPLLLFEGSSDTKTGPTTTGQETALSITDAAKIEEWVGFDNFVKDQINAFDQRHIDVPAAKQTDILRLFQDVPLAGEIGAETGITSCIYARITEPLGQILNTMKPGFAIPGQRSLFAEYKCLRKSARNQHVANREALLKLKTPREKVPDGIVMRDDATRVGLVMEFKTCWTFNLHTVYCRIRRRSPDNDDEDEWQEVLDNLAQIVEYMVYAGCMYGCLSTYQETLFLKLNRTASGGVKILVSPMIHYRTRRVRADDPALFDLPADLEELRNFDISHCTMRECFFAFGLSTSLAAPTDYQWQTQPSDARLIWDPKNREIHQQEPQRPGYPTPPLARDDEEEAELSDGENREYRSGQKRKPGRHRRRERQV